MLKLFTHDIVVETTILSEGKFNLKHAQALILLSN